MKLESTVVKDYSTQISNLIYVVDVHGIEKKYDKTVLFWGAVVPSEELMKAVFPLSRKKKYNYEYVT